MIDASESSLVALIHSTWRPWASVHRYTRKTLGIHSLCTGEDSQLAPFRSWSPHYLEKQE